MEFLESFLPAWDEGQRELAIALEGVTDEDLWVRPHERLLSIGELAGHITYYEAAMTVGQSGKIQSLLVDSRFDYYTSNIGHPIVLDMGADELRREVARVHAEAKGELTQVNPSSTDPIPWREGATWGGYAQYLVFHVAYHTGQIYSARHMMGHETEDN